MKISTAFAIALAVALTGCGGTRNWKEEVRQPDDRIVVINRYDELGNMLDQEPGNWEFGPPVVGFRLRIPVEGSWSGVTWESGPYLIPLVLGIKGRQLYLAATPNTCAAYDLFGRPVPPYVFFRHDGNEWKRIPVEEFPEEVNATNLLQGTRNRDARQEIDTGYVKADAVKRINRSLSTHLRSIYRSGVKGWEQCIKEINAGWYKNQTSK